MAATEQLDEILVYLSSLMASPNDRIVSVALDTVGILLECYPVTGSGSWMRRTAGSAGDADFWECF